MYRLLFIIFLSYSLSCFALRNFNSVSVNLALIISYSSERKNCFITPKASHCAANHAFHSTMTSLFGKNSYSIVPKNKYTISDKEASIRIPCVYLVSNTYSYSRNHDLLISNSKTLLKVEKGRLYFNVSEQKLLTLIKTADFLKFLECLVTEGLLKSVSNLLFTFCMNPHAYDLFLTGIIKDREQWCFENAIYLLRNHLDFVLKSFDQNAHLCLKEIQNLLVQFLKKELFKKINSEFIGIKPAFKSHIRKIVTECVPKGIEYHEPLIDFFCRLFSFSVDGRFALGQEVLINSLVGNKMLKSGYSISKLIRSVYEKIYNKLNYPLVELPLNLGECTWNPEQMAAYMLKNGDIRDRLSKINCFDYFIVDV